MRPDETFNFLVEREKLLNNMASLRTMSRKMSMLCSELQDLYEEVTQTRREVQSLKSKMSETAYRLRAPSALIGGRES